MAMVATSAKMARKLTSALFIHDNLHNEIDSNSLVPDQDIQHEEHLKMHTERDTVTYQHDPRLSQTHR